MKDDPLSPSGGLRKETGLWATALCAVPVLWYSADGRCVAFLWFVAWFWLILQAIIGLTWALLRARPPQFVPVEARRGLFWRRLGVRVSVLAALAALSLSVPLVRWPARLAFALSRPALEALADRVERGEAIAGPVRAGLWTVGSGEWSDPGGSGLMPGGPFLWLERKVLPHCAGGVVRGPYEDGLYGTRTLARLSGDWFQVCED